MAMVPDRGLRAGTVPDASDPCQGASEPDPNDAGGEDPVVYYGPQPNDAGGVDDPRVRYAPVMRFVWRHEASIYGPGRSGRGSAGRPPSSGRRPAAVDLAQDRRQAVAPRVQPLPPERHGVSRRLSELVMWLLEKRRTDRPRSASVLLEALRAPERSGRGYPASPRRRTPPGRWPSDGLPSGRMVSAIDVLGH